MKIHSFYDLQTGILNGRTFMTSLQDPVAHLAALALNIPAGCGHVEGKHDHQSRRVAVERLGAGEAATPEHVMDYQPPAPDREHDWDAVTRRWLPNATARAASAKRQADEAERRALESRALVLTRATALGKAGAREQLATVHARLEILGDRTP